MTFFFFFLAFPGLFVLSLPRPSPPFPFLVSLFFLFFRVNFLLIFFFLLFFLLFSHFHSKRSGRTGSSKPPNFFEAPVQPSTNLGGDGPQGTMKEADIIQHCIDREKARQLKDYTEADRIRKFCSLKIFVCCLCGFASSPSK